MIVSFADRGTEDVYDGTDSRKARQRCPKELWQKAQDKMTLMNAVSDLESLKLPPGNRLERFVHQSRVPSCVPPSW
jgi:toxin HigB-1